MNTLLEKSLALATEASIIAKELALALPRAITVDQEGLHEKALNMLLACSQLETTLKTLLKSSGAQTKTAPRVTFDRPAEEIEDAEVIKLNRRVPRWARNPNQINAQILACYLRASAKNKTITEDDLRKAYVKRGGNEDQFNKNYPQMKTIAQNNHGKVFEVVNGTVTIWGPAAEAVETFKRIYQHEI